jgi:nucleoside-diphosphate-sugar epimerase
MRILLTGVTGFIGSHLARRLVEEGHRVFALVRPKSDRWRIGDVEPALELIVGDLERLEDVAGELHRAQPEICLHLAWRGWSGTAESADGNLESLRSSLNFAHAVLQTGCPRLIVAGTCFEYDVVGSGVLTEESAVRPHDLYGACKHALHLVLEQLARTAGSSLAWPRIFYTYGPHEDPRRLLPSVLCALLRGDVARTTGGAQVRDYLHVEDVASALWAVARSPVVGAINIASGVPVTVRSVAEAAAAVVGARDRLHVGALPYRPGEPMVIQASGRRLREDVGWTPRYDLATGLAQTVRWWQGEQGRQLWRR